MRFAIAAALILFLVLTVQGFAQQRGGARGSGDTAAPYQPPATVEVVRDIVYASYGNRDLLLDLYLPAERGAEPISGIVVIRGGGWRQGRVRAHRRLPGDQRSIVVWPVAHSVTERVLLGLHSSCWHRGPWETSQTDQSD